MSAVRTAKIVLVGLVGTFGLLTGIDNILDTPTTFEVVRHAMSMDATPPGNRFMGRAITSETLHHLVYWIYWIIIVTELFYAEACAFSAPFASSAHKAPHRPIPPKGRPSPAWPSAFLSTFSASSSSAGNGSKCGKRANGTCRSRPFASLAALDWSLFFFVCPTRVDKFIAPHLGWQQ